MQWRQWLAAQGLVVPVSPNLESVVLAVVLAAGSFGIGWFVGARGGPPLTGLVHKTLGRAEGLDDEKLQAILRNGVAALLLSVVGRAVALNLVGLTILAVALGLAVGGLVYPLARSFRLARGLSALLAAMAGVAATAGTLGGLEPLIASMSSLGISIGSRRITLLAMINFLVVAAVLFVAARVAAKVLEHSITRMKTLDTTQRVLAQKLGGIAVIAVAVLIGIDLLGVDLTAFAVFSGAFGLAVGFGLQKTFGNLLAGLILLMDRSVKPGDVIVVGDTFGAVSKIGVRAVSVVTRDGKEHLIPNEQLMVEPVENWSYSSRNVRVHIPVGVAYSSDIALAQRLMVEAAEGCKRVLKEPKPSIWLTGYGDSSVDHEILAWIADPEMGVGNVRSEILNRLWVLFKDNGVEIPFPQRDLHIRSMPAPEAAPDKDA